ncbi:F-box/LRR-repeat/kelch-repeat protein, partial [Clarias magur]
DGLLAVLSALCQPPLRLQPAKPQRQMGCPGARVAFDMQGRWFSKKQKESGKKRKKDTQ